jgi:hypothetical protein
LNDCRQRKVERCAAAYDTFNPHSSAVCSDKRFRDKQTQAHAGSGFLDLPVWFENPV